MPTSPPLAPGLRLLRALALTLACLPLGATAQPYVYRPAGDADTLLVQADLSTGASEAVGALPAPALQLYGFGDRAVAVTDAGLALYRPGGVVALDGAGEGEVVHVAYAPEADRVYVFRVSVEHRLAVTDSVDLGLGYFAPEYEVVGRETVASVEVFAGTSGDALGSVPVAPEGGGQGAAPVVAPDGQEIYLLRADGPGLRFAVVDASTGQPARDDIFCPADVPPGTPVSVVDVAGLHVLVAYEAAGGVVHGACDLTTGAWTGPAVLPVAGLVAPLRTHAGSRRLSADGTRAIVSPIRFRPVEAGLRYALGADAVEVTLADGAVRGWGGAGAAGVPVPWADAVYWSAPDGTAAPGALLGPTGDPTSEVFSDLADYLARESVGVVLDAGLAAEPAEAYNALARAGATAAGDPLPERARALRELIGGVEARYRADLPLLEDVRPLVECVDGETVWFGYENRDGVAGRIPLGSQNGVAPAASGTPPRGFRMPLAVPERPGRTAYYPAAAFALTLGPDLAWSLLGREAASEGAPSCATYLPDWQAIEGLPGAVAVAGGVSASFAGRAFRIHGSPHALDGDPTDGPPIPAVAVAEPSAAASLQSALSQNQTASVSGAGPSPAIVTSPLPFGASAWADGLASRAGATLSGRRSDTVGTPAEPVVAYAPSGVTLSGGFRGVGVLVVDGTLEMQGNAEWVGLVLVRGPAAQQAVSDVGGSARVVGGLVLVGAEGAPASLSLAGRASVLYSPEALALARRAAFRD